MYSVIHRVRIGRVYPVRPWWMTDASSRVVMSIKFGAKPVEFEKGEAGIVVGSKDKLPALIDALIVVVRAGELDELFSQAAKAGVIGKPKRLDRGGRAARPLPGPFFA
jgi:hypothetical protein